jgi:chorismate dehydratase
MRIGAVNYLNSKPLVYGLESFAPEVRLYYDLPSRLADSLAAGRLDVALIPTVEFFRGPGYSIVSNACVACRGPVLSVALHFRVPPAKVRRVALDEGSRTSAALTQILLAELCGIRPEWETLPIGSDLDDTDADAVLLIGDRAMVTAEPLRGVPDPNGEPCTAHRVLSTEYAVPSAEQMVLHSQEADPGRSNFALQRDIWDLGEVWCRWTGLPFAFAMWIARPGVDAAEVASVLGEARDKGVRHLAEISARESAAMQIPQELAARYLRDNLYFTLGVRERQGLRRFYQLCVAHQLAPRGLESRLEEITVHGCSAH